MKTSSYIIAFPASFLAATITLSSQAQTASTAAAVSSSAVQVVKPAASTRVIERGTHYKKMESVGQTVDRSGQISLKTNRWTVLQNGMNYQDANGDWVESCPVVQSFAEGIVCTGNTYRVILKSNLNTDDAVDLETPDHQRIVSHPAGIGYYDPDSGKSVLLAQIKDCQAELVSSNQIVFRDAFDGSGIEAAVVYTYGVGRFHQDVTFAKRPAFSPADFGMGNRTRLEILSEIVECPLLTNEVQILKRETNSVKRAQMAEPDLVDETPVFSAQWRMTGGRAFQAGQEGPPALRGVAVAKRLLPSAGNGKVLVEAVGWNDVRGELGKLPAQPTNTMSMPPISATRKLPGTQVAPRTDVPFADRLAQITRSKPVLVALNFADDRQSPNGFTVDWEELHNAGNFYFDCGVTYLVPEFNEFEIWGASYCGAYSIKFGRYSDIIFHDWMDAQTFLLTAIDDDTMGQTIDGSTGCPSGYYGAVILDTDYNGSWGGNEFRFMYAALEFGPHHPSMINMGDSTVRNCNIGFDLGGCSDFMLEFYDVYVCGVNSLFQGVGENSGIYLAGSILDANCNDLDGNGLPDSWECQYFSHLGVDPNADTDGDGASNYQEFINGTNPNALDQDSDGLPDWWEWQYLRTLSHTATDLDVYRNTLLYDYQHNIVPQICSFYILTKPLSQDVFAGDTVTFTVETGGNPNLMYQWTTNGVAIGGATQNNHTIDRAEASDVGDYVCNISDGRDSVATPVAHLNVVGDSGNALLTEIMSDRQDYTFKSGVTYLIEWPIRLYGKTTFEGGAILKFDWVCATTLMIEGTLVCEGEPYNPTVLTSVDDDSIGVGFFLSFFAGDPPPQPYDYDLPYLDLSNAKSDSVSNLRIKYANQGVIIPSASRKLDLWDCQFFDCSYGIMNTVDGVGARDGLHNVLFASCSAAVGGSTESIDIEAEHVTADVQNFCAASSMPDRITLTNSIVWGNTINASSITTVDVEFNPDKSNFQIIDAGAYYLTPTSLFHHAGSANISPRLQTEFKNKTTYPPASIPRYTTLTGEITFAPQAPRYTGGAPDLGYYYDALDYTVANMILNGATLTILPGTAIGYRQDYYFDQYGTCWFLSYLGFDIYQNSTFVSRGTPDNPNVFVDVQLVQEQFQPPVFAGIVPDFFPHNDPDVPPTLDLRFCHFFNNYYASMEEPALHIWSGIDVCSFAEWSVNSCMYLNVQNCRFTCGQFSIGRPDCMFYDGSDYWGPGAVTLVNTSFNTVNIHLAPTWYQIGWGIGVDMQIQAYNNLFKDGAWFELEPIPASAGDWIFKDNLFDKVNIMQTANTPAVQPLDFDHNGYWPLKSSELDWLSWQYQQTSLYSFYPYLGSPFPTSAEQLQVIDDASQGQHEVKLDYPPPYQIGPLGNYYLPPTTPLYNAGSRSPADAGLYHYTTRVDQVKEGSKTGSPINVDIGLHYVATASSSSTTPKDTDGDGIPDYVENWHGDGDTGANRVHTTDETDWNIPQTLPGTDDPRNPIYDDIDLDGDGLTGAAERLLGTDPLIPNNQLNLSSIPQLSSLSGTVTVPLSISADVDDRTSFDLLIDGTMANATIKKVNGNWFLVWDTLFVPNGPHVICLACNCKFEGYMNVIFGEPQFVDVNNAITLDEVTTWFTDQLNIDATVNVAADSYSIDVYDAVTEDYLVTLPGNVSNGKIETSWDLKDDSGDRIVNGPLRCDFYLTPSPSSVQAQSSDTSQNDNPLGAPSASESYPFMAKICCSAFVIAWADLLANADRFNDMMLHAVVNNLNTLGDAYGTDTDYGLLPTGGSGNKNIPNSSAFMWGDNSFDTETLLQALADGGNFFYCGHGSPNEISPLDRLHALYISDQGLYITAHDVASTLGNNMQSLSILRPYRLVIMDACNCYSPDWAHAFGFAFQPGGSLCTVSQYEGWKRDPQAFVAWNSAVERSSGIGGLFGFGPINDATYEECLNALMVDWQNGTPIWICMFDFTYRLNVAGYTGYYNYKISGCVDLDNSIR